MKTLYIVRHAKSSWDHPGLSDDERPLINKGVKRTHKIASFLQKKNIKSDILISSYAKRAFETARIIAAAIEYPEDKIKISRELYHGNTDSLYDELFALSDNIESAMIFGHNPTFTSFANHFLSEKTDWLPTTGVVAISFKTDKWTEIPVANHKTEFVIFPRDL
jgi:phosphohistidine phosphatase